MNQEVDFERALSAMRSFVSAASEDFTISQIIFVPNGWVFSYDSKKYVDTGEVGFGLVGNTPRFITMDGKVFGVPFFLEDLWEFCLSLNKGEQKYQRFEDTEFAFLL